MTNEEIIADERYHTCGRCKWEDIPFICHQCKWGEDVRKDLSRLKEEGVTARMTNEEAIKILSKVTLAYEIGKVTITQKEINEALDFAIKALGQQRPKGRWLEQQDIHKHHYGWFYCSECGAFLMSSDGANFCSCCGAEMEADE